jgi:hypothetical protein
MGLGCFFVAPTGGNPSPATGRTGATRQ